ncbi:sugar ABC transporter permease [Pseudorhodobacter sp. E13]|uniref:ABC transporter permease n=1 Tax=Pseudorhodobacter sp. E13 TaxID=2487931 RepID=UPI000F8DF20A|nr:ABC transporter permease [Pseudorhodobacter sp. E13]RUS64836.1 sugar ABC transporter permease [Pseudorhodobacter sp. E13]
MSFADWPAPAAPAPKSRIPEALRSITALVLREMSTRYGRTPGGYVWALLEPMGMILLLSFAWSLLAKAPTLGTSFLLFKATGFLVLQMVMVNAKQVGGAMLFSRPLLFYPRVTWLDAILARFILNTLVVGLVAAIILTGIMLYEDVNTVLNFPRILLAMVLAALLGLSVGILNCYLFQRIPVWQQIWGVATRPMFLISGVIFVYEDLPQMGKQVLWYNPVLHLTGIMRDGFYPLYHPTYISGVYLGLWIALPMLLGLLLLRQFHRDLLNM